MSDAKTKSDKEKHTVQLLKNIAIDIIIGGVSSAISKTISAPFERVKLLLQIQDELIKSGRIQEPYHGIIDCLDRTIRTEGFFSLWRGNLPNIIRYFPTQIMNYLLKGYFTNIFTDRNVYWKMFLGNIISGGLTGACTLIVVYSLDYASTRLSSDTAQDHKGRQFNGLLDVYQKTLQSDGITGLYRGFIVSIYGIIIYRSLYFGFYDIFRKLITHFIPNFSNNFLVKFMMGWFVTIISGLASYPMDTVRRRMMMTSCEPEKYHSDLDCAVQIFNKEGILSFFKGASVNILRSIVGALALCSYDVLAGTIFPKKNPR